MALNETYEAEISVPYRITNVPKNVILASDSTDTLHVTVRDKGFTIAAYLYSDKINTIPISFSAYASDTSDKANVSANDLQKLVYQQLYSSSKVIAVKPDKLTYYYNYGESKRVPIVFRGKIMPTKNYYLAKTNIRPRTALIYAPRNVLKLIKKVYTEDLRLENVEDTIIHNVRISKILGVKIVPSTVKVTFFTDILTEESIEVPIQTINVPDDKNIRLFPSKVKVHFTVGSKKFRSIKPEMFTVVADYNDLDGGKAEKCLLRLRAFPNAVRNAKLELNNVDYLIEQ